jgi:hypothetical protein
MVKGAELLMCGLEGCTAGRGAERGTLRSRCTRTYSESRFTAKYMRCGMLPQMNEKITEKIMRDARQQLEKARLGQVKIASDYEAFLSALAVGHVPTVGQTCRL